MRPETTPHQARLRKQREL